MALFRRRPVDSTPPLPELPPLIADAMGAVHDHARRGKHAGGTWWNQSALRGLPAVCALLDRSEAERAAAIVALVAVAAGQGTGDGGSPPPSSIARAILELVTRRAVVLNVDQVDAVLQGLTSGRGPWLAPTLVAPLERSVATWDAAQREAVAAAAEAAADACGGKESVRLRALGQRGDGALPVHLLDRRDPLGAAIVFFFEHVDDDRPALADAMELFASLPTSGKPSAKWLARADGVRGALRDADALVIGLLVAATESLQSSEGLYLDASSEAFMLGALRFAGTLRAPELLPTLAATGRFMIVTVGGQYGSPRSVKLANAAVVAIADAGLPASITELQALQRSIRHGSLLNQITKSIDALAAAQGLTTEQLLEQAVERHDLLPDGTREVAVSAGAARITVTSRAAALAFVDEAAKLRKSFPPSVKENDAEALTALKEELKVIRKTLAAERHRLDGLLAADRRWPVEDWRRLYLDHPITGRVARDLIWVVDPAGEPDGTPSADALVGRPVDGDTLLLDDGTTVPISDGSTVSLWHPVLAAPTAVGAWRQHCIDHALVQPVKQAFREIYVITPAERETGTYSNRFAGHVFRQVQARALMKGRGWKAPPLAWWDDGRDFAVATSQRGELVVEFVYDPIEELEPDGGDLYPLCTSDQVRFRAAGVDDPVELASLPQRAFSEAMRDVDLFIGVTSIGADPEWEDRGPDALADRLRTYWNDYGFGDLGAAAEIRREVLGGLVPMLAIADRCELDERFLVVRGDLRTYRIHIGSGNIQMEPNAEYLCIVKTRSGAAGKLFLPLDDDPVLTLILSKAFLLAGDASITDETIVEQIKRR